MRKIEIENGLEVIPALFGPQDTHRRLLERALGVRLLWRSPLLRIEGEGADEALALSVLQSAINKIRSGGILFLTDLQRLIDAEQKSAFPPTHEGSNSESLRLQQGIRLSRGTIIPKSENQKTFLAEIEANDLVFCSGPAGTGKTFLAMAVALRALRQRQVSRIVLTRPAVEAGERLGFLPGTLVEKVNPYLRPLFDALYELLGPDDANSLISTNELEIAPLAFMRGRTLGNAFVILDEAQNATVEQMRMFLTRIGRNSRVIVTGDPSQSDLGRHEQSGFAHALGLLSEVEGIAMVQLSAIDVVRHPLVRRIIHAYERDRG